MHKHLALALFILTLASVSLYSQPSFPPYAPLFDSATVARIDISINPDTLVWIYDNVESETEFHASFSFNNGTINETVQDVGFRLRGNTSRYAQKKSFKISFNTFIPGRKFYGVQKLNLNGEHNDPSIIRSRLCWTWIRGFGLPGPRATHVRVYINGNYYGLYIMVEHVDEQFINSSLGNNDGNLYECLWPADLNYLGSNPDLYKYTAGNRRAYDLKTNTGLDDYTDLAHFIDVLNNTPVENLACELDKVFNLQDYLKNIAMDVVTGNWDGYIYNKNNFYLYHNTESGKFEYLPYDLDNTFGIDWFNIDWGTRNIYTWEQGSGEMRPLYTRLMEVPEIRAQYTYYMKQLIRMLGNTDSVFAAIDQMRTMISPYVINDPYHSLDYGYTYMDFISSYTMALGNHVKYGLEPYLQTRLQYAQQQAENTDMDPAIKYIKSATPVIGKDYWVRAYVEDEDPAPMVKLQYRVNQGFMQFEQMYDDGNHRDKQAGDGYYGIILPALQYNETLSWQVNATDQSNHSSLLPCTPASVQFQPSSDPKLFINELMAENDSALADEFGEYDDWAEIYNGDTISVWLGDKYLSDDLSNPNEWELPDYTMAPGSFLLIWCDGQPDQGPFHASFKLNDEGEEMGIFDSEATGFFLIDSLTYGQQHPDISYGRSTDGFLPWVFFPHPTPGYSNNATGLPEHGMGSSGLLIYPNPVLNGRLFFRQPFSGKITDITGRNVWNGMETREIDTGRLEDGMYIVTDLTGHSVKLMIRQGR